MATASPLRRTLYRGLVGLFVLLACGSAAASTFAVKNTNDTGPDSLHQAILDANANPGADTIVFAIGSGAQTIALQSALPALTDMNTTIDGTSQPGYAGVPLIRIDGSAIGGSVNGLQVNASVVTIKALIVTGFSASGIALYYGSGIAVTGCYIGTDGTTAFGNGTGIDIDGANNSSIGAPNNGNVISGNSGNGVYMGSGDAATLTGTYYISFYANRIGTNPAGTAAISNGAYGMRIFASATTIGNALASSRNIVSGNASNGIAIETGATDTGVYGAYIGVAADGVTALGNGGGGITDGGTGSLIGDTTPGGGNVVSGNTYDGIALSSNGSLIVNNFIGTDASGTAAIPNHDYGIRGYSGNSITIGGVDSGSANLVSGNANHGISVESGTQNYRIVGNRIGTDITGTAALGNNGDGIAILGGTGAQIGDVPNGANLISGNSGNGISISGTTQDATIIGNIIGLNAAGSAKLGNGGYGIRALSGSGLVIGKAAAGNVISGNARGLNIEAADGSKVQGNTIGLSGDQSTMLGNDEYGIQINSADNQVGGAGVGEGNVIGGSKYYGVFLNGAGATGNHVEGNIIGTDSTLAGVFGNYFGVVIFGGSGNFIGGTAANTGNTIVNSTNMGIYNWFGSQNSFLGNRISNNGGLGIDLDPIGPVPNDALDVDHGPNNGQNYPLVTAATSGSNMVFVGGKLASSSSTSYRIEYFVSTQCDGSGLGEGEHYIGYQNVASDTNGNAVLDAGLSTTYTTGYLTATATSADGSTSEFSPCIAIDLPGAGMFNIASDPVLAYEDLGVVHVPVVRSSGLSGAASVRFKTSDGTATAPADYGAVDKIVSFADGESIKIVDVAIVLDNVAEGTQNFHIDLSQATGGAMLGAQASVTVDLFDHDPATPFYIMGDASTNEPATGQVVVNVPVLLSAPTNHVITLDFSTQDGTAMAGLDYVATSGHVVFAIGESAKTIPVTVKASTASLNDRVFYVLVTAVAQQVIAYDGQGDVVIKSDVIFRNDFD